MRPGWWLAVMLVLALAVSARSRQEEEPPRDEERPAPAEAAPARPYDPQVEEVLRAIDARLYSPWPQIRDLVFEVRMSMFEQMMPGAKIRFYFEKPDKALVRIESEGSEPVDPEMAKVLQSQMKQQMLRFCENALFKPYLEAYRGASVTLERESTSIFLTVEPGPGGDFVKQVLQIGPDFLPVRAETVARIPGMGEVEETSRFHYEVVDGRRRIRAIDVTNPLSPTGEQRLEFEYATVDGLVLVSRVTSESGIDLLGPMVIEFRDHRVNEGIDDSVFRQN